MLSLVIGSHIFLERKFESLVLASVLRSEVLLTFLTDGLKLDDDMYYCRIRLC